MAIASGIFYRRQRACDGNIRDFWILGSKRRVTIASGIFGSRRQKACDDSIKDLASAEGELFRKILLVQGAWADMLVEGREMGESTMR